MALTPAQLATLKAAILADPALNALPNTADGNVAIAAELNKASAFVVRKRSVPSKDVGPILNYVAVSNLTTANRDRATTFLTLNPDSFAPTADVESYWDTTFGGALGGQGQATRDALAALWRRVATRFEQLFATGTGTTVAPGALVVDGPVTAQEVESARNLP